MKIVRILPLLCLTAGWALGQAQPKTFTMTATTSPCAIINVTNNATVGILVSGTFSGTLTPTLLISGVANAPAATTAVTPTPSSGTLNPSRQATILGSGGTSQGFTASVGGFTQFSLCPTTFASGTATVTLYTTPAVNIGQLGGEAGIGSCTNQAVTGLAFSGPTCSTIASAYLASFGVPWQLPAKCSGATQSFLTTAGKAFIWEVNLPIPTTTTKVGYSIYTADNASGAGHNYDLALYFGVPSTSNNRILHIGSSSSLGQPGTVFAPTTGWLSLPWFEGSTLLYPGRYYLMLTSDCIAGTSNCAQWEGDSQAATLYYSNASTIAGSGGASPATYTAYADAPNALPGTMPCLWIE
jgi:hypothetical protein